MAFLRAKKGGFGKRTWQERKDITFRGTSGTPQLNMPALWNPPLELRKAKFHGASI